MADMLNRLAEATSPYLLQHSANPVHWQPWDAAALAAARSSDKPILLSVGYAACHWCHVMAHESFENPAIAALMNEHFVNIKVDREERPDLDQLYQHALALLGQHGGWPLTMFLTPAGEPFWGGTYFPPESRYGRPGFPEVLETVGAHLARRPGTGRQQHYRAQGRACPPRHAGAARSAVADVRRRDRAAPRPGVRYRSRRLRRRAEVPAGARAASALASTMPMPFVRATAGDVSSTSSPSMRMVPSSGGYRP